MADDRDARIAQLETENAALRAREAALVAELSESRDQQTATAEILRVVATSPTNLQSALDAVAERAARVCHADDAQIYRRIDETIYLVAHDGPLSIPAYYREGRSLDRTFLAGRAMLDQRPIHIDDYGAVFVAEFPEAHERNQQRGLGSPGHWTILSAPLIRDGVSIGAITVRRVEVRPFSE